MRVRRSWIGAARLFEPEGRFLCTRLQQMNLTDHKISIENIRISGAEPDRLLLKRDCLAYRAGLHLTHAESKERARRVPISGDYRLKFGDSLFKATLCPQQLAFREMRKRAAGSGC